MIKMISIYSGGTMYVAEDRLQEYLDAGHRIATKAEPKKPAPVTPAEPAKAAKPKKRAAKK